MYESCNSESGFVENSFCLPPLRILAHKQLTLGYKPSKQFRPYNTSSIAVYFSVRTTNVLTPTMAVELFNIDEVELIAQNSSTSLKMLFLISSYIRSGFLRIKVAHLLSATYLFSIRVRTTLD